MRIKGEGGRHGVRIGLLHDLAVDTDHTEHRARTLRGLRDAGKEQTGGERDRRAFPCHLASPRAGQLDGHIGSAPISGSPSRVDQVSRTSNVELLQRVHNVPLFHDLIDK